MQHTEAEIIRALNRLILRVEMDRITTQMIVDEAGVSRATFYRHFKDKYDVLNRNYKDLLDSCLLQSRNYRELFFKLYTFARDEWSGFYRAFRTTGVNSFESYITVRSRSVVEAITRSSRGGAGLSAAEELQLDVFCFGVSTMYRKWTNGEYDLSPEAAADALFALMPESLRNNWFPEDGQENAADPTPF